LELQEQHTKLGLPIFSTVGDMFPKKAIATITGIGGMAGGIGSFIINKGSGVLFDYAHKTWTTVDGIPLLQKFPKFATERIPDHFFEDLQKSGAVISDGINKGYMIIFSICAVTYLIAWFVMKSLVPKYQVIK
jgi:ACS family hexuronate transporter-like MFS transporter